MKILIPALDKDYKINNKRNVARRNNKIVYYDPKPKAKTFN